MISRAALARSVCLRCQLRLFDRHRAYSPLRIPPFRSELLHRRQYSAQSAWDRLEADSKGQRKEALKEAKSRSNDAFAFEDEPPQAPADPPSSQPSTIVEPDAAPTSRNEAEPAAPSDEASTPDKPVTFRKFSQEEKRDQKRIGKRIVYLQREHLKATMLGEKARTIVMRDAAMTVPRRPIMELPVEELLPSDQFDIAAQVEAEESGFSLEEALDNIDELRPSDPIVLQSEFDPLLEVLFNGFTVAQLKAYLVRASSTPQKTVAQKDVNYGWIEKEWPWAPQKTLEVVGSPKQRLCITLMKDAWQLKIRAMVEGKGAFAAKVSEQFLALLARDDKWLSSIRETYLDEGETISVSTRRLRIRATKPKTDTILKKLDEAARNIVVQQVPARWISSNTVDDHVLELLGRLTNTYITYNSSGKKLHVSMFGDSYADDNAHEHLGHVVQRLLYTALHPRDASVTLRYPEDTSGRLIPEVRGREKLSWMDRLTQWSRWVKPTSRISSAEPDVSLKVDDVLPRPLQAPPQDSDEPWSKPYNSTTASFGHLLHKNNGDFSLAAAAENKNHLFSPTSPPPASLASLSQSLRSDDPLTTALILTFRPHPSLDKKTARDLPELLELHLTVPDDLPEGPLAWDTCPKRLVAVLGQNFTDVAYPSQPVDLRLSQPLLADMSSSALDASPFREYIETAKLDLMAGDLRPPPQITLSDLPSARDGKILSRSAQYMFAGLEMRRTLDVAYEGHQLQYTSIQAGHHGGRRAEMVLEAAPPADAALSEKERGAHAEEYLALVQDLAQGKIVKWVGERDTKATIASGEDQVKPVLEEAELDVVEEQLIPAMKQDGGIAGVDEVLETEPDVSEKQPSPAEEHDDDTAVAEGEAETPRES